MYNFDDPRISLVEFQTLPISPWCESKQSLTW
jgi:hypothetical protein